jgi:hypothetical protein
MKNCNRRPITAFAGKTNRLIEFVQAFNGICPPAAKKGQNISPFDHQQFHGQVDGKTNYRVM